jgi:ATP-dependent Lon protease
MKESIDAARSYVRSKATSFGIKPPTFDKVDIHVHVPEGATPKDGPSAGAAMATAIISVITGIPVRRDVAMTGEVTLRGRVLPIGGVKEKVLGAFRAGIREIILPRENEPDLEDLPEDVRGTIDVHLVDDLGEALSLTLRGARFEAGHLLFEEGAPVLEPSLIAKHN